MLQYEECGLYANCIIIEIRLPLTYCMSTVTHSSSSNEEIEYLFVSHLKAWFSSIETNIG